MKRSKSMYIIFLGPAILTFLIIFVYPGIRTAIMSFFFVKNVSDSIDTWNFVGLKNYTKLFESTMFVQSLKNIGYIYFWGVIIVMFFALLFAVILNSGVKFKAFFRSVIYLPNLIAAVATGTVWLQYVYNSQFGLLRTIFDFVGLHKLAAFQWTADEHLLSSMTITVCFGSIGYFMLVYMAAMDKIPEDFYEAATLEGANIFQKYIKITLPLIRNVFRTTLVLWSTFCLTFFSYTMIFSNVAWNLKTVTPMVYMYNIVFQDIIGLDPAMKNAGAGAAVGIILTVITVAVFSIINIAIKEDNVEY